MAVNWVPFTNQKLYLAKLQFDLAESESDVGAPLRESARQAGLMHLQMAWVGLLNEVGESFKVKGITIQSLADLEKSLGASMSEVSSLLALHEASASWLRLLQREYDALTHPQPKAANAGGSDGVRIQLADQDSKPRYQLILQDMKEYIAAFRDRTHEW